MEKLPCAQCRPPCPLGEISPQQVWALDGLVRPVSLIPGQVLFEQGDPHNGCYLICAGIAMLFNRAHGRRRIAGGVVGPGDIVGVVGLLGQERHELSVYALMEVQAQRFSRAACERLARERLAAFGIGATCPSKTG